MKVICTALLCIVHVVNGVRQPKENALPTPDSLAIMGDTNSSPLNMDTVFLPTPSLSSETLPLPTPSPDSYTWATPTPSPGTQPSKTTEKNDKPRTSPTNRRNDTPTPWTANGRNDTHTPRTTEHNGNSTLSITAEVSKSTTTTTTAGHISILPVTSKKHDLSKTAESGAKTASINFYLVIIYGLMKHLYLALLCAVYLVNDVDPSRTNEQRKKRNVMVITSGSAPTMTKLQVIWTGTEDTPLTKIQLVTYDNPTPSQMADMELKPTASPSVNIGFAPTPSTLGVTDQPTPIPYKYIEPDPTPSPVRDKDLEPTLRSPGVTDQPTPSPSGNSGQHPKPNPRTTTMGLSPTPIPPTNKELDQTPGSSENIEFKLTPSRSSLTSIVSNGVQTPSQTPRSGSAKVTPTSIKFSTTSQNGAKKVGSLNHYLVFYCCLVVFVLVLQAS